jgi:hypothetical protein
MQDREQRAFPPAPWKLRGEAVVALKLVPGERVQSLVPADTKVWCPYPGHTVAMLYLARYSHSPVGPYHEFIMAPAVVRIGLRIGFWISRITVDADQSLAAGRAIWDLPKERASFQWQTSPQLRIHADDPVLSAHAAADLPKHRLRLPFLGAAFGRQHGHDPATWFIVRGVARVGVARGRFEYANGFPSAAPGYAGSQRLYVCTQMEITIGTPRGGGAHVRQTCR